jgi:hypothetical protein
MSTDNKEDELEKMLEQLIKCNTQGDHSWRDTCVTKRQFLSYLERRDKARDQQIALDARLDELQLTKDNHPITGGFHGDCHICKSIDERIFALTGHKEEK